MEYIDIYDRNREKTGLTIPREGAKLGENQYMLYALCIIEDAQGRYLITQRSNNAHWGVGWWEVSGGGVPAGETPASAIVREVREEVGLDISGLELKAVYSYENVDLDRGDNYFTDIFHAKLDFAAEDVILQEEEASDFKLATWEEICQFGDEGVFLHFARIQQALQAEGVLN